MLCKYKANRPDYQILVFPHMCGKFVNKPQKVRLSRLNLFFGLFKKVVKSGRKTYLWPSYRVSVKQKIWYLKDQGTVVMTNPTDHQAGVEQVIISPQKRGLPAPANHQIPVSTKQVPDLVKITTEMKHVIRKKVFHRQEVDLTPADQNLATVRQEVLQVEAPFRAADLMTGQKVVLVIRLAKRKATHQEEKRLTPADRHQMTDRKEVLVENRKVKRKAIRQEIKPHTLVDQHLTKGQKEVLAENLPAKEDLQVNPALKAVRDQLIKNSAAGLLKAQDIKNAAMNRSISHSANQPIHHTINRHLKLSAVRMKSPCVPGKNLRKMQA